MVVLWVIWIRFIITRTEGGGGKVCAQIVHMRSDSVMKDDANRGPGAMRSSNHTIFSILPMRGSKADTLASVCSLNSE